MNRTLTSRFHDITISRYSERMFPLETDQNHMRRAAAGNGRASYRRTTVSSLPHPGDRRARRRRRAAVLRVPRGRFRLGGDRYRDAPRFARRDSRGSHDPRGRGEKKYDEHSMDNYPIKDIYIDTVFIMPMFKKVINDRKITGGF